MRFFMPKYRLVATFLRRFCVIVMLLATTGQLYAQKVFSITVNDGINPATAEFISGAIHKAADNKANCVLINLNTPGGLLKSTREIVSSIMQSPVPVIVYVSPTGAHAGSAGVFITMASHIAAMAPGTNVGAAHPVSMQGQQDAVMMEKGTNDAAAFLRSIAEKRGRNVQWAEEAVRMSESVTESEAIEKNIIDLVAANEQELLAKINGKQVLTAAGMKTIVTKNATVETLQMGFFQQVLSRLSDPNIAYILMMIGFYGLMFELFSPGAIFPGIIGVISLILAFYAMSSMPVNYTGVALIVFGIILFLLEIKIVSHGMLAIGGILSVLLGSLVLFRESPSENFVDLSWSVIISVTAVSGLFFFFLVTMGIRAQKTKIVSGQNAIIGKTAVTMSGLEPAGQVRFQGETWNAVSTAGHIAASREVIVQDIKGLTLFVASKEIST